MFWKVELSSIAHPHMFARDGLHELHELANLALDKL